MRILLSPDMTGIVRTSPVSISAVGHAIGVRCTTAADENSTNEVSAS